MDVPSILFNLKELYGEQSRTARYEISKQLFYVWMTEGTSVQTHVLKMIDLITHLGQLDFAMDGKLSQDLILQSLSDFFSQFVINYHMNKLNISLPKLLNILKTTESYFKGEKAPVLFVDKINKKKGKKSSKKNGTLRLASPRRRWRRSLWEILAITVARTGIERKIVRNTLQLWNMRK